MEEIKEGMMVEVKSGDSTDWMYNMYNYGCEAMHSCIGLGKSAEFPILRSDIVGAKEINSAVSQFHKTDIILWFNPSSGHYSFTAPAKKDSAVVKNIYYEKILALHPTRESLAYFSERFIACTYQLNEKVLVSKHNILGEINFKLLDSMPRDYTGFGSRVKFVDLGLTVDEDELFFEDCIYYALPE